MLLGGDHLHKDYGIKPILVDESVFVEEKDKIGIIGVNGSGKSTLMKIMSGLDLDFDGTIQKRKDLKTSILEQSPVFHTNKVWDEISYYNNENFVKKEEYVLKSILTKLGFSDFDAPISELSGGQKRRLSLACALAKEGDVLFLDEPTNHLDNEMVEWLESYLHQTNQAVVMVTHDRYFLERVCSKIIEIDKGRLYVHEGNYDQYLENKALRIQQETIAQKKLNNLYKKELEWVRAGVQARSTKSKSRLDRFEELRSQRRHLQENALEMNLEGSRLGSKTIEWKDLAFGYDCKKMLFHDFSYLAKRTDRIGFIGPNGCGKTTLMKILSGQLEAVQGSVQTGSTVRISLFRQDEVIEDLSKRVIDYIEESARQVQTKGKIVSASSLLERFLFTKDMHYLPIERLSGGERRRLYLLKVLMEAPNLLILDEPTNDLDLITLEILEDYLDSFGGMVFVVSHDRYFLDRVCDYLFVWQPDGTWKQFIGGYAEYLLKAQEEKQSAKELQKQNTSRSNNARVRKGLSWAQKKELKELPSKMEALEDEIAFCNSSMSNLDNYEEIEQLTKKRDQLEQNLASMEEQYLELLELEESGS